MGEVLGSSTGTSNRAHTSVPPGIGVAWSPPEKLIQICRAGRVKELFSLLESEIDGDRQLRPDQASNDSSDRA